METTLFSLIFIFGIVVYYISTRQNDIDLSNTYQVQYTFLSLVVWAAMLYNSFNIETLYNSGGIVQVNSRVDYTFIAISLSFFVMSLLNLIILGIYGSWNMLFKMVPKKEEQT